MKDFYGTDIAVGDYILYSRGTSYTAKLGIGRVTSAGEKDILVATLDKSCDPLFPVRQLRGRRLSRPAAVVVVSVTTIPDNVRRVLS